MRKALKGETRWGNIIKFISNIYRCIQNTLKAKKGKYVVKTTGKREKNIGFSTLKKIKVI